MGMSDFEIRANNITISIGTARLDNELWIMGMMMTL